MGYHGPQPPALCASTRSLETPSTFLSFRTFCFEFLINIAIGRRSIQAELKAAARPVARQVAWFLSHRGRVRGGPCMSKFCAVHVRTSPSYRLEIWPYAWPAPRTLVLYWRRPRRGGAAELDQAQGTRAGRGACACGNSPAIPACMYSWHARAHIHAHHEAPGPGRFCYARHPPPRRPAPLGAGAEPNPEARPPALAQGCHTGKISKSAKIGK